MCSVRLCPREGTKNDCRLAKHLDPITGLGYMGETLGFGGIFAYICSKHLHTSYSNLFPCFSYGDAGFKNKCAFLVRNCCGSKMYHYSMISKVRKPFLATPPKAGLGLFLLLCGLTPNAAWLVWAATSYPSKTFHIWLLLHLLNQELQHIFHHRRQMISLHPFTSSHTRLGKHVLPVSRQAPAWSQENSLCVPGSPRVAHCALLFHKQSPRWILLCQFLWPRGKTGENSVYQQMFPQIYEMLPCLGLRCKTC